MTPKPTAKALQQKEDQKIRIEALNLAARNKPSDYSNSLSHQPMGSKTYDLVGEAIKIEAYIKTGKK